MPLDEAYRRQASLLIKVVPFVATETSFALKGGTAINLFLRDMPPLSVDIDLTYLRVGDRSSSLKEIDAAMRQIGKAIKQGVHGAHMNASSPKSEKAITKLIVRADDAQIKIEVTPVLRGCVYEPAVRSVSARALLDLPTAKNLPAVRWKLENLAKLKANRRALLLKGLGEALGIKES